jgi:catechol 2,3-dioxygenase-like lactoylglutathione lyase family enzyme
MQRAITGLDHLIVGVRDLEAARATWARLGFNSTPRGRHVGWATANYCIMFEDDYLELLGIVDPAGFTNGLDERLAAGEGLMGLALGTSDAAQTAAAWRAAGLTSARTAALGRLLESGDEPVELRFETVILDAAERTGLGIFACRHLTPGPMRRPAWLRHPNGATRIAGLTVVADDIEPLRAAAERLVGSAAMSRTDSLWTIQTGTAPVILCSPQDALLLHPDWEPSAGAGPTLHQILEIGVTDLEETARFLALQHVSCRRGQAGALLVEPESATGVDLAFVA